MRLRRPTPATPSRRITWFTLLGLVLVPLAVGGVLLAGLWDPTSRLDRVTAAVVNEDQPVELEGQTVPLGRQLAAGLVDGSADAGENYTWVLTDASDAREGLADGEYTAVVTIPKTFSAAATSTAGDAAAARQATIDVRTTDRSRALDDAITAAITSTARTVFNRTLTTTYLDNLYVGFTGVQEALTKSADGATSLASGAGQLTSGTRQLASGADQLASGARQLDSGAGDLASWLGQLSSGVSRSASGAGDLASGAGRLASGAGTLAGSADQVADATAVAGRSAATTSRGVQALAQDLGALGVVAQQCQADPVACQPALFAALGGLPSEADLRALATAAGTTDAVLNGGAAAGGRPGLVAGTRALAGGADDLADGARGVSSGAGQLASGLRQLRSGAASAASGADQLAAGASRTSDGATQLASGAGGLTAGAGRLETGTKELADGLTTAAAQVPSYSADERTRLSSVAAEPLAAASQSGFSIGGAPVVALLAAVALWLGGLATWLILSPVAARALGSTRSSVRLALRGALPGVGVGVVQGVVVGALMLAVLDLAVADAASFVALAALAGVAFALVQQGLAGLFGGVGRFAGMLLGAATLGAGVVSTAPSWLSSLVAVTPVGTGLSALRDAADGAASAGGVAALVAWAAVGLLLATAATARARSVRVGAHLSRPVPQLTPA